MCAVNGKFLAVVLESQGGGAFLVVPLSKVGRFDLNIPKVAGHKNLVMDIAWNPFDDNEIASCSEDCTIKIWTIPDEGLNDTLVDCKRELVGHSRKCGHILWHPCATNILASNGFDNKIIIWNTASGEQLFTIDGFHEDTIYSMCWSYDGGVIATTCKDKKLRLFDVRAGELLGEGECHQGTKPARVIFCGSTNKLFTTGFSRQSDRQYALWDPSDLSKPLTIENVDTSSGVQFPFYDEGTKMVYLAGKGDTVIRYFEIVDEAPYVFFLSMYQGNGPQRGVGIMPKKEMRFMECEVMRFFRLQVKGIVEPLSMTVPRKSDMFQDDIYPPCESGIPALTGEEWASGISRPPRLLMFTGEGAKDIPVGQEPPYTSLSSGKKGSGGSKPALKAAALSTGALNKQSSSSNDGGALDEARITIKELTAENDRLREENDRLQQKVQELEESASYRKF